MTVLKNIKEGLSYQYLYWASVSGRLNLGFLMSETLLWKKKCIRNTVFADQRIWDRSVKIMAADWLAGAWSILSTRNFVFSLVFTILRTPCAFLFSECWHFFVRCKVARAWNKSHIFKCQGWKLIEAYFKTHHTWWVWCLDAKAAVLL